MSIGSLGLIGGLAGAQTAGLKQATADRDQQEVAHQSRAEQSDRLAERAAGIGRTDEEHGTSDRDADGHRLWEGPPAPPPRDDQDATTSLDTQSAHPSGKDPTGTVGGQLDLSG